MNKKKDTLTTVSGDDPWLLPLPPSCFEIICDWVRLKDKEPEENTLCALVDRDGDRHVMHWNGDDFIDQCGDRMKSEYVTYWFPLPELPKD